MTVDFLIAKDGNKTCKINQVFMHSAYSPVKESERFVQNIKTSFEPDIIFICEPCLSYCTSFLRIRFPKTKLAVIRFSNDFEEYDLQFDYVFYLKDFKSAYFFLDYIFNFFGENILSYSLFLVWEPSGKIFSSEITELLLSYKKAIEKCHSILRTRAFFETRWITNTVRTVSNLQNLSVLKKKGTCPVIICASGPSLKNIIPILSQNKNQFLIAVSSALKPLVENNIIPDIVITTDGGFWAKKHLLKIPEKTIIALGIEGNVPFRYYTSENPIMPLVYDDGLSKKIFSASGLTETKGLRCGTVSGTALDLALNLSSGDIYFTGLDLQAAKGFQHTQNNELEILNSLSDNNILSKEKRNCTQGFSSQKESLKLYEEWFNLQKFENRKVFRVIENPKNHFTEIKDISSSDFSKLKFSGEKPSLFTEKINSEISRSRIQEYIKNNKNNDDWLSNTFPVDYLNYLHTYDENLKETLRSKILSQNKEFIARLCRFYIKK